MAPDEFEEEVNFIKYVNTNPQILIGFSNLFAASLFEISLFLQLVIIVN